jgi:branched-chain amino acid aminotransferase
VTVWINGRLLPDEAASVSIFDRGLAVGDGVFETVKVTDGAPFALTRHLARLRGSAEGLGLATPDTDAIRAGVLALLEDSGWPERARVRITVTAGISAQRSERDDSPLTVIVTLGQLAGWGQHCDVVTVPWPRSERSAIAGLKTTSYAENVLALSYAREHGGGEAVFGNLAGNLCEGAGTNVFVVTGGRLITPPLSAGCLAGVTRDLVIEWVGAAEEDMPLAGLAAVEEAFLTGTTRDVQPVRRVDGVTLPGVPGAITQKAADVFSARSAGIVDP